MSLNLTVCVMHNFKPDKFDILYEFIPTWEEADILAQYAMQNRADEMDLIFIFPGWNRGIDKTPELWNKAIELAERYKPEK